MYPESEILFPPRCIPLLAEARGKAWKALVRRVARLPEDHPDTLALSLTVIRLAGGIAWIRRPPWRPPWSS